MFAKLTSLVTGTSLPFALGEDKGVVWNWWSLHDGKLKADGSSVSVFKAVIPLSDNAKLELARNSLKRLRGLKHPSIVSFKDSHEVPDRSNVTFYLVTEPVTTLASFLQLDEMRENATEVLAWGLRAVVSGVSFLNNECKLIYGNLCLSSVFVSHSLDWKLGIFDLLSEHSNLGKAHDPQPFVIGFQHVRAQYLPGEVHKKEWHVLVDGPEWAIDAWGIGCFIQEIFRGSEMNEVSELRELQAIPKVLTGDYQRLLSSHPHKRMNPAQLVDKNSFFKTKLNDVVVFLESLILKEEVERNRFFRGLKASVRSLPSLVIERKILPACVSAVEFGNVSSVALQAIFDLVECGVEEAYFESGVLPFIVKLLGSPDVSVRLMLLQSAHKFINLLSNTMVESKFYPNMQNFFKDPDPRIRDQTIKCLSLLAPKMNQKTLNSTLLPHLAQLQRDPEAAIRTNTTVLISKISVYLGEASCKRILLNAFTRVLNDPVSSVRNAGILALKETSQYYSEEDIARKLIPLMSPLVMDPDPSISVASFQCLEKNFSVLKSYCKNREKEIVNNPPPPPANTTSAAAPLGHMDASQDGVGNELFDNDDGAGWGDDLDDLIGQEEEKDQSLSSLENTVNQQMSELMTGTSNGGAQKSMHAPAVVAKKKHVPITRASKKPMKLGATKRQSKMEDDGWGDLLNS